ncbi:MAG TPA: ThuA domain-containing protein [Aggregatilineaceae bacterium]|nr:ThuA domain-containing protein [Aggregatilineaceae bacterium]
MLEIAVITGGHHYHVPAFHRLFRELPGIDAYIQHLADFVASPPEVRQGYDGVVFYTHLRRELEDLGLRPGSTDSVRSILEELGASNQGLVVMHHSLLAFPDWDVWNDIVGMADRSLAKYAHGQTIRYHIEDAEHPICAGLDDWMMQDETYLMPNAVGENHILITTDHPDSMATLAWTHDYKLSRVFCLQAGDDQDTWANVNFRTLLTQGIRWCATLNAE